MPLKYLVLQMQFAIKKNFRDLDIRSASALYGMASPSKWDGGWSGDRTTYINVGILFNFIQPITPSYHSLKKSEKRRLETWPYEEFVYP